MMNTHLKPPHYEVEKRRSQRLRVLKEARIIFNNRFSILDCSVRDISETGCRLRLPNAVKVPDEFIVSFPTMGMELPGRVVWRSKDQLGVKFLNIMD